MKILIIEDEKHSANHLEKLLKTLDRDCVVERGLESIAESVSWLQNNESPDLIMMDIRLADGLSFEIFKKTEVKCPVVFTTAYDEYAVNAFKVNSVDYLLKPISLDDLKFAMDKFNQQFVSRANPGIEGLLKQYLSKDSSYRSRFLIPFRDGFKTIEITEVNYFYSEFKVTHAVLGNGRTEALAQTLEDLQEQTDPKQFFRLNRQYLVSLKSIYAIHNYFNGKLKVSIDPVSELWAIVSKEKAPLFKHWLDR